MNVHFKVQQNYSRDPESPEMKPLVVEWFDADWLPAVDDVVHLPGHNFKKRVDKLVHFPGGHPTTDDGRSEPYVEVWLGGVSGG